MHSSAVQTQLFVAGQPEAPPQAAWADVTEPGERMARFYADSTQAHAARSEADGVLRLYWQRIADLDAHIQLLEPEIVPLGLLMIVPEGTVCR